MTFTVDNVIICHIYVIIHHIFIYYLQFICNIFFFLKMCHFYVYIFKINCLLLISIHVVYFPFYVELEYYTQLHLQALPTCTHFLTSLLLHLKYNFNYGQFSVYIIKFISYGRLSTQILILQIHFWNFKTFKLSLNHWFIWNFIFMYYKAVFKDFRRYCFFLKKLLPFSVI